jgi:anti-sigma factor RsiW
MTSSRDDLLHAHVDGELDPVNAAAFEQRIAADPALAAERARIEALQRALRERLPRERLDPRVRRRIASMAGPAEGPSWRAFAASVALALLVGSASSYAVLRSGQNDELANALVANHLRALMAPQPIDVASSDRHTVKPWFNGKIARSPQVADLSAQGFPLLGGRIDVINTTVVPTLVYRRAQHLISLTALPAAQAGVALKSERRIEGYNLLRWTEGEVVYWAASDVAMADLEAFARDFRTAAKEQ